MREGAFAKRKQAAGTDWYSTVLQGCDAHTRRHMRNVARYARILVDTATICLPNLKTDRKAVVQAAVVHDVGKKVIPPEILFSRDKLTGPQLEIIRQHPVTGACLLAQYFYKDGCARTDLTKEALIQGVLCHHERWDGSGYPFGLKERQIPLSAQVVALADVYDALISVRPYKEALSHEQAMSMISEGQCGAFSPEMIRVLTYAGPLLERCKTEWPEHFLSAMK